MATVSLLRGLWQPHRTRAQGLVRRAANGWDASRGEAPAATYDDGLRARNAMGGEAWRQRQLMKASLSWLNL
ncbi:MAG: hypothetical protein OXP68_03480 [Anaerolineaceae bacterium]|nr:hypothetical protein [Anaerolineaceae bacterium]MDE0330202.1 hypothetical protein [Anaerolineaceae bacterium]